MNALETKVLLALLHQNERLVAIVHRLLEEVTRDRYSGASGHAGLRIPVEFAPSSPTAASEFPASTDGPDRVLQPAPRLDADRGEPRPDDPGGADADSDAGLPTTGAAGILAGGDYDSAARSDRGLYRSPGPGVSAESADRGGDSVPPGGDGAGDDQQRVGDGDADAHADCRYYGARGQCRVFLTHLHPCRDCEDYDPQPTVSPASLADEVAAGPPAPPVVAAAGETRHCRRCDRDLPITAFRVRSHVCDECRGKKYEPTERQKEAYRSRQQLARDPGYQHGLSAQLVGLPRGTGKCTVCGKTDTVYEQEDRRVCYPCLQAADREKPHCVICGAVIVGRRSTATTCGPECQREAHRRQCAEYYEKKKEARAGAPA